jgi:ArsR family transcriptional regulator
MSRTDITDADDNDIDSDGTRDAGRCCGGATRWLDPDDAVAHATRLAAIADPIRLQVVSIIANAPEGEVCACDFVEPLGKSQPTISHHLKVLAEAGLIEGDKRGRWVWYRLSPGRIAGLATLLTGVARGEV